MRPPSKRSLAAILWSAGTRQQAGLLPLSSPKRIAVAISRRGAACCARSSTAQARLTARNERARVVGPRRTHELAQAELYGDRGLDRNGLIVEEGGLIFPRAQGIERGLLEQRRAGDYFHVGELAGDVNDGVHGDFTFNLRLLSHGRIIRRRFRNELRFLHAAARWQQSREESWDRTRPGIRIRSGHTGRRFFADQ